MAEQVEVLGHIQIKEEAQEVEIGDTYVSVNKVEPQDYETERALSFDEAEFVNIDVINNQLCGDGCYVSMLERNWSRSRPTSVLSNAQIDSVYKINRRNSNCIGADDYNCTCQVHDSNIEATSRASASRVLHQTNQNGTFKCSQCNHGAISMSHLKELDVYIVPSERYSCNMCKHNFLTEDELKLHINECTKKKSVFINSGSSNVGEAASTDNSSDIDSGSINFGGERISTSGSMCKNDSNVQNHGSTCITNGRTCIDKGNMHINIHARLNNKYVHAKNANICLGRGNMHINGENSYLSSTNRFFNNGVLFINNRNPFIDSMNINSRTTFEKKYTKKFNCPDCEFESDHLWNYKRHLMKHGGELPFKCSQCKYGTSIRMNLIAHERRNHSDDETYKCDLCPYKNTVIARLKKHKYTRHKIGELCPGIEEKKFKCTKCFYQSDYAGNLRRHEVVHA